MWLRVAERRKDFVDVSLASVVASVVMTLTMVIIKNWFSWTTPCHRMRRSTTHHIVDLNTTVVVPSSSFDIKTTDLPLYEMF